MHDTYYFHDLFHLSINVVFSLYTCYALCFEPDLKYCVYYADYLMLMTPWGRYWDYWVKNCLEREWAFRERKWIWGGVCVFFKMCSWFDETSVEKCFCWVFWWKITSIVVFCENRKPSSCGLINMKNITK